MRLAYVQNHHSDTIVQIDAAIPAPFDSHRETQLTFNRLMDESERQLEYIARRGTDPDRQVSRRILDCPETFLHWQGEHAQTMHSVAAATNITKQSRVLLSASLSLLHRKSLFEYLRDDGIQGRQREQLLMYFHSGNDYARAMVLEHGNYLRSAASYACSTCLGVRLMRDALFEEPLQEYQVLYAAYFATYCKLLTSQTGLGGNLGKLAYKLKCQLGQRRRVLLSGARALH